MINNHCLSSTKGASLVLILCGQAQSSAIVRLALPSPPVFYLIPGEVWAALCHLDIAHFAGFVGLIKATLLEIDQGVPMAPGLVLLRNSLERCAAGEGQPPSRRPACPIPLGRYHEGPM